MSNGMASVDGLVSGLNTTEIIDALVSIEKRRVSLLEHKQNNYERQLSALREVNTRMLSLKTAAYDLSKASSYNVWSATSSDEDILTVTAGSRASVGSYALTVLSKAKNHQIASQGFDSTADSVGTGSIQVSVGDTTTTIDIASGDSSLQAVRDAINNSDAGVIASIINDGSDVSPYRLMLTSEDAGTDNEISVTTSLTGGDAPNFSTNSISDAVAGDINTYVGSATSGGTYTGTGNMTYEVRISQTGTVGGAGPAYYEVSEDGGETWSTATELTSDTISLSNGVTLTLDSGSTVTQGDTFTIDAYVPTVQEATQAQVTFGSGDGAITYSSSSNEITDLIPGLTINLLEAEVGTTVMIDVERDTEQIKEDVKEFVEEYNSLMSYVHDQIKYDAGSETAGILSGDANVRRVQGQLTSGMLNLVAGLEGTYSGLFGVGVSVDISGKMELDEERLDEALADDFDDVVRLFSNYGTSSNSGIEFVLMSDNTQADGTAYDVDITQAATRGSYAGTTITDPVSSSITIDEDHDTIVVSIGGGDDVTIELNHGTYGSGTLLATEIQNQINNGQELAQNQVTVSFVDEGATGHFVITSGKYGSNSSVSIGTGLADSAQALLGLDGGTSTSGTDVQGTINGESAAGSGQILTADEGNATTEGLVLNITLTPDDLIAGAEGTVSLTRGVAGRMNNLLDAMTDITIGSMKTMQDGFQNQIDDIEDQIDWQEDMLEVRRNRLVQKFAAMESALRALQSQSSFLMAQLSGMPG